MAVAALRLEIWCTAVERKVSCCTWQLLVFPLPLVGSPAVWRRSLQIPRILWTRQTTARKNPWREMPLTKPSASASEWRCRSSLRKSLHPMWKRHRTWKRHRRCPTWEDRAPSRSGAPSWEDPAALSCEACGLGSCLCGALLVALAKYHAPSPPQEMCSAPRGPLERARCKALGTLRRMLTSQARNTNCPANAPKFARGKSHKTGLYARPIL